MKPTVLLFLALATLAAQVPNPTQQPNAQAPVQTGQPMPIFTRYGGVPDNQSH